MALHQVDDSAATQGDSYSDGLGLRGYCAFYAAALFYSLTKGDAFPFMFTLHFRLGVSNSLSRLSPRRRRWSSSRIIY